MSGISDGLGQLGRSWDASSSQAWDDVRCPHCGAARMVRVAALTKAVQGRSVVDTDSVRWLRCAACGDGALARGSAVYPPVRPFARVEGLPEADERIWDEARTCFGASAYTAAVMLCRKLLLHVAVDKGLSPRNDKGRAPSFKECVDHLESEGVITRSMLSWVDRIKDVGNEATHEINPLTKGDAEAVGAFTQQLLTLAYALDNMMREQGVPVSDEESQ
ncbi:hypothetical protein GCM10022199_16760 [Marihabitans asiaticum]|uniref:Uncharacterized protein DUF4145 n=1 Tax=Marihabitans asiaticum TaxID=415218 RepID=A0A560W7P1_9MICO|nr:DUF4145 domain-containing protein [Marihabitans asiaticum]TWD13643.1 uncharacterized protein DUF4145 [Marihabitans asiaticum]